MSSSDRNQKSTATLTIDPDTKDSYNGVLLKSNYNVAVTLTTPLCITNPVVSADVKIVSNSSITDDDETAVMTNDGDYSNWAPQEMETTSSPVIPAELEVDPEVPPSYSQLLQKMKDSLQDWDLIDDYSTKESLGYKSVLENLTPNEFATLVSIVDFSYDQKRVAGRLAEVIGSNFTCEYVATACGLVSDMTRADMVKATAPLAVDLSENRELIEDCLDAFEKIVCASALKGEKQLY